MQGTTETPKTRQGGFHNHLLIRLIQVNGGDGGASIRADGAHEGSCIKTSASVRRSTRDPFEFTDISLTNLLPCTDRHGIKYLRKQDKQQNARHRYPGMTHASG